MQTYQRMFNSKESGSGSGGKQDKSSSGEQSFGFAKPTVQKENSFSSSDVSSNSGVGARNYNYNDYSAMSTKNYNNRYWSLVISNSYNSFSLENLIKQLFILSHQVYIFYSIL